MNKNISNFYDFFKIRLPSEKKIIEMKDSLSSSSLNRQCLSIQIEATHSGKINNNLKYYIPSRMRDGVGTFTDKKPAKILKHHKIDEDPVGVIRTAEYIDTIPEYLMQDKNVQIMMDSSYPINKQMAAVKRFIQDGYPLADDFKGLGHIKLNADIYEKETIEQLLDGRLDAASTFFVAPNSVFCSECGQNLIVDGYCGHEPGEIHEDENGVESVGALVPGIHKYIECSLVVRDADPYTLIEIGNQDNIKTYNLSPEDIAKDTEITDTSALCELKDFKEETTMKKKPIELSDFQKMALKVVQALRVDMKDAAAVKMVSEIETLMNQKDFVQDQKDAALDEETVIKYALEYLENKDQKVDSEVIYTEIEKELDALDLADKKLDKETISKLSETTFCGPDNSFPIPDSAHVTAAQKLIERYEGPGNKVAILASVNRKAKALGSEIPEVKDEKKEEEVKFSLPEGESLSTLSDEEARTLFAMAESQLISRKLTVERECSKCADYENQAKEANDTLAIQNKETEILADQLKYLRIELRSQANDYATLMDEQIKMASELKDAKTEKLAIVGVLKGDHKDIDSAKKSLNLKDLVTEETILMKDFSLEDSAKKLNNGMARIPEGEVLDPTLEKDNVEELLMEQLAPVAKRAISNIKEYLADGQEEQAKQHYVKMVYAEILDEDKIPFSSLSADSNETAD